MGKSVHTPEYDSLVNALRAARLAAGLSQMALCSRLALTHTWVAKVEGGERRIDVVELHRFCAACGADFLGLMSQLAADWRNMRPAGASQRRLTPSRKPKPSGKREARGQRDV